jgi:hypothetical protein
MVVRRSVTYVYDYIRRRASTLLRVLHLEHVRWSVVELDITLALPGEHLEMVQDNAAI